MFALIPTIALLAGISAAAPTVCRHLFPSSPFPCTYPPQPNTDLPQYKAPAAAAGATIYKSKHFAGDSTAIPANTWCTDLSDIFGDFDGQVRSLAVEKGYRCQFFL